MPLTYMYITNRPQVARIAQNAGVDRVWIDLEYMGKEQRQKGMDSVKSRHQLSDIRSIRPLLRKSALQVRVNPLHDGSPAEISAAIDNGADIVMLPMWKTADDVKRFVELVNGRAKVLLLLETKEADRNLAQTLEVKGVDAVRRHGGAVVPADRRGRTALWLRRRGQAGGRGRPGGAGAGGALPPWLLHGNPFPQLLQFRLSDGF